MQNKWSFTMVLITGFVTLSLLGLVLGLIARTFGQDKDRIISALMGKGAMRPVAPTLVLHRPANDDGPLKAMLHAVALPHDIKR
jgi:hypothetical protein